MTNDTDLRETAAGTLIEYRCCFCDAAAWMPDAPGYNGILHEGCPEGGTWIRRLDGKQLAELAGRADYLADQLGLVLDTLQAEADRLPAERRALVEQAKAQAAVLFELTGKIAEPRIY